MDHTDELLRESLLDVVSEHCCWGTKAATDMTIVNVRVAWVLPM